MAPSKQFLTPTILSPLTLPGLLHHVLTQSHLTLSQTTLLICTDRTTFLHQLLTSISQESSSSNLSSSQEILTPTLHNLLASQRVSVVFCASVQSLLTYLSVFKRPVLTKDQIEYPEEPSQLVLVNPLALHATTPSFSAQGLSRTFSAAVETARRSQMRLVIAECVGMGSGSRRRGGFDEEFGEAEEGLEMSRDGENDGVGDEGDEDPWEQEVPILNVSAKRFGGGNSERGWAGRTVKARRVVGRWCRFESRDEEDVII